MINYNSCAVCGYSITDPVCRSCYIKQTKAILQDLKTNSITNEFISNKIKGIFPIENLNNTECILCRKGNVTLCRYCFSLIIVRILNELNFTEDIIENFKYQPMYDEVFLENSILEDKMEVKIYDRKTSKI